MDSPERGASPSIPAEQVIGTFAAMARAIRQPGGFATLTAIMHQRLGVPVAIVDQRAGVIALAPARTSWDPTNALKAGDSDPSPLTVTTIDIDGEPAAALAAPVPADAHGLLEFGASLVSLELARRQALQSGRRELIGQVVEDVVHRRMSDGDAVVRLAAVGVRVERPLRLLIGRVEGGRSRMRSVPWNLHLLASGAHDPYTRAWLDDGLIVFVEESGDFRRVADSVARYLDRLGDGGSVGVSEVRSGAAGLRLAFFEAMEAAARGPGVHVATSADLGRLLLMTNVQIPLREISARVLEPLTSYDERASGFLAKTLAAYLANDRDQVVTADELFIHRNTLRYRLRQIEELTAMSLNHTADIVTLWLAIQTLLILEDE